MRGAVACLICLQMWAVSTRRPGRDGLTGSGTSRPLGRCQPDTGARTAAPLARYAPLDRMSSILPLTRSSGTIRAWAHLENASPKTRSLSGIQPCSDRTSVVGCASCRTGPKEIATKVRDKR